MEARNGRSFATQWSLDNAASLPNDAVRLSEFNTGMSGVSRPGHTHVVGDITGFAAGVDTEIGLYIVDGDTVVWFTAGGHRHAEVKRKAGGGLLADAGGLSVDIGPSGTQVAAGNHTHSQLHDPVTLGASNSITGSLSGQQVTLEVRPAANGGLLVGPSGISVDFGSGHNQAARGDHTHSQLHDPVSVVSTATLKLYLAQQSLSGVVALDPSPGGGRAALGVSGNGIYVPLGTGSGQAAAGDHVHAVATASRDGFLAATDYQKFALYQQLLQVDASVGFSRNDLCPAGDYVGGRHRWGQGMEIRSMHMTARAPSVGCLLGLEIGGTVFETLSIPGGASEVEVSNFKSLTAINVSADAYVRVVMVSGVGVIENEASKIDVSLVVRPAIGGAPVVKINCGGGLVPPFIADAYYDSGGTFNSAAPIAPPIDLSGVTSPAPEGVYQTCRRVSGGSSSTPPLNYVIPGLARGINYTVRLHFCDIQGYSVGQEVMTVRVLGLTTQQVVDFDVRALVYPTTAYIQEFVVAADVNGRIRVQVVPQVVGDGVYNYSICGVECVPS